MRGVGLVFFHCLFNKLGIRGFVLFGLFGWSSPPCGIRVECEFSRCEFAEQSFLSILRL